MNVTVYTWGWQRGEAQSGISKNPLFTARNVLHFKTFLIILIHIPSGDNFYLLVEYLNPHKKKHLKFINPICTCKEIVIFSILGLLELPDNA